MPHAYFEHDADVGVLGSGPTLEAAFEGAARATFAVMADLAAVAPKLAVRVEFEESDTEIALVRWLNALLAEARTHGAVFCEFSLSRDGDRWRGEARGEPWREGIERGTEVKGATLTQLSVRRGAQGWEARCIVDV